MWKDTESNLLMLGYSTPSTEIDYDRMIFYDDESNEIFIKYYY